MVAPEKFYQTRIIVPFITIHAQWPLEFKDSRRNRKHETKQLLFVLFKENTKWLKQQHGVKARSTPEVVLLMSTTDAAESEKFVVGGDDTCGYAYAIFRTNHGKEMEGSRVCRLRRDEEMD